MADQENEQQSEQVADDSSQDSGTATLTAPAKKPAPRKLSSVLPKSSQSALGKRTSTNCDPSCSPFSLGVEDRRKNHGDRRKSHRAAVTLRLEPTRYLCLKMAAAKTRRTSQDILTIALDRYLKSISNQELDDCVCLKKLINGEPSFGDS